MYIYIYTHTRRVINTHTDIPLYVCAFVYIYIYIYVFVYWCSYLSICLSIYLYYTCAQTFSCLLRLRQVDVVIEEAQGVQKDGRLEDPDFFPHPRFEGCYTTDPNLKALEERGSVSQGSAWFTGTCKFLELRVSIFEFRAPSVRELLVSTLAVRIAGVGFGEFKV